MSLSRLERIQRHLEDGTANSIDADDIQWLVDHFSPAPPACNGTGKATACPECDGENGKHFSICSKVACSKCGKIPHDKAHLKPGGHKYVEPTDGHGKREDKP